MKKIIIILGLCFLIFPGLSLATDIDLSEFEQFTGEDAGDYAGYSVSSAGDINGDGYDDILIGAYKDDNNASGAGAAYLIYGDGSELSSIDLSAADVKFIGKETWDYAGRSVSSAGDVNNDGYDDILIGVHGDNDGGDSAGAAYLIYGQEDDLSASIDLSTEADVKFTGEDADDYAGTCVASAGDVNGDGYDDILIGADEDDDGGTDAGAAYLIYGQASSLSSIDLSAADVKFTGESANDYAGSYVASAGDVNNDGYDDILIGTFGDDDGGTDAGAAYLIYGQSPSFPDITLVSADVKFTGEDADDYAGRSVSSAGDVNGDGYDDILISAFGDDDGGSIAGAAYLIYGESSELTDLDLSAADVKFTGEDIDDYAGRSVASAGDVNGDGYDDILISAYADDDGGSIAGAAYLIYGESSELTDLDLSAADVKFIGEDAGDYAGACVASAGDVNNDGYDDILIGAFGDADGGVNAGAAYLGYVYIDSDGDGVAGDTGLISGTDCDDDDATVYENQTYYADDDSDGYGDSSETTSVCSLTTPSGYVTNSTDSNDNDYDNDGSETGTDCDDDDNSIYANQTYYLDSDGDGYGDSSETTSVCSLTTPLGYVTNSTDSNDNDYDNDGSETGTDCDDDDNSIYDNQTYYLDSDEDGLGSDETTSVCSLTTPDGYVDNSNDPDDTVAQNSTYYRYDPMDKDQHDAAVTNVEGWKNGKIKVTYKDGTSFKFTIFNTTDDKKTKAKQYRSKGYYIVSQPRGKKLAIVDIYTGEVKNRITIATEKKYPNNGLKIMKLQNKYFAVLTSRKKSKVRVYATKILINTPKFGKDVRLKITDEKVAVTKSVKYKNHKIRLKGSKGKVRHTLKMDYKTKKKEYSLNEI